MTITTLRKTVQESKLFHDRFSWWQTAYYDEKFQNTWNTMLLHMPRTFVSENDVAAWPTLLMTTKIFRNDQQKTAAKWFSIANASCCHHPVATCSPLLQHSGVKIGSRFRQWFEEASACNTTILSFMRTRSHISQRTASPSPWRLVLSSRPAKPDKSDTFLVYTHSEAGEQDKECLCLTIHNT